MIRIIYVLLALWCFNNIGLAQLISNSQYKIMVDSINHLPIDSVDNYLNKFLVSKKCTRFDSARLYNLKGNTKSIQGELEDALSFYNQAVSLFNKQDGYLWEVKTRLNISSIYSDIQEFTNAGNQLFKVKEIVRNNADTVYEHKVSEYFAHLFYSQGNIDSAFYYLEELTGIYEGWKDTISMSRVYNNLAVLYKEHEQYQKALFYNKRSLNLSEAKNDEYAIGESFNNMGICYEALYHQTGSKDHLKKALHYYEESALLKMKFTHKWNSAIANLARLNRELGNDKEANEYYNQLELSGRKDKSAEMLDVYRDQMLHLLNKGKVADAAFYFAMYDSVISDLQQMQEKDFQQMLLNQRKLYQARKNEQEQKLKLQEEQQKRLVIEKKQFVTQTVFIIFAFIVVGFFYYLRQRNKYLNLKAEQDNKKLKDAVFRTQMNPHFVYNALTAIQNSVLKEDQLVTASYVARFARLIRQTFDFASVDRISLEEDVNALRDYIETQKIRFGDKFGYEIITDEKLKLEETFIPPLILQPLVENSIHHGFKGIKKDGLITIKISRQDCCQVRFEVMDNGVGYHPVKKDNKEHALSILKSRLALFQPGDEESFVIENNLDGGTKVSYVLTLFDHV